ncbi:MAG: hypothetical protein ACI4N6_04100 [Eubacteriales bacterium]
MKKTFIAAIFLAFLLVGCSKTPTPRRTVTSFSAQAEILCTETGEKFTATVDNDKITVSGGNLAVPITYENGTLSFANKTLACKLTETSVFALPQVILRVLNGDTPDGVSVSSLSDGKLSLDLSYFHVDIIFGDTE